MRNTSVIVRFRKLRNRQQPVPVDHGRLRTRTAQGRAFVEQQLQVIRRLRITLNRIGRIQQRRQLDQRRHPVTANAVIKFALAFTLVTQRAKPGLVVDRQQVIDFGEAAHLARFPERATDELPPPPVGRCIAHRARQRRLIRAGIDRVLSERQIDRIEGESLAVTEPTIRILKDRTLRPRFGHIAAAADQARLAGMVDMDFDRLVHANLFLRPRGIMRRGSRPSSISSPSVSLLRSANWPTLSTSPRIASTVT